MIKVTIENEDLLVAIKDNDAWTVEDACDLISRAMTNVYGYDIEVEIVASKQEDTSIYIEQDQPKDHIQHEGM